MIIENKKLNDAETEGEKYETFTKKKTERKCTIYLNKAHTHHTI